MLNKYLLNEYYVREFDIPPKDKKSFVSVCFSHFTCVFVSRERGVKDGFNNITESKVKVKELCKRSMVVQETDEED